MKKQRILELADYVEGLEHKIDISDVPRKLSISTPRDFHMDHCPQCLIGQTGVIFYSLVSSIAFKFWNSCEAEEVLGLDKLISNQLFFPNSYAIESPGNVLDPITPQVAACVLRNLVETGRVEWPQRTFEEFCQSDSHHDFDLSDD